MESIEIHKYERGKQLTLSSSENTVRFEAFANSANESVINIHINGESKDFSIRELQGILFNKIK